MRVVARATPVFRVVSTEPPHTVQSLNGVHKARVGQRVQSAVEGHPVIVSHPVEDLLVGKGKPPVQEISEHIPPYGGRTDPCLLQELPGSVGLITFVTAMFVYHVPTRDRNCSMTDKSMQLCCIYLSHERRHGIGWWHKSFAQYSYTVNLWITIQTRCGIAN
jgi:hypothetical protein